MDLAIASENSDNLDLHRERIKSPKRGCGRCSFPNMNAASTLIPHVVFTMWVWQAYHQEVGSVFLLEAGGVTNRSDMMGFQC